MPACVTAGTGFVGVRCPAHSVTRQLLSLAGVPVAAPSANRFGHVRYDRWFWIPIHVGLTADVKEQVAFTPGVFVPGPLQTGVLGAACLHLLNGVVRNLYGYCALWKCWWVLTRDVQQGFHIVRNPKIKPLNMIRTNGQSLVVFPPPSPSQPHSSSSRDGRSWEQRHPCLGW